MTDAAAETLIDGRYRILERIGSGGMAEVFLADDTQLGRRVALKILHRRFAEDEQFVERFKREASSAAALQHPNVVAVFDRGEHEGTYYIAMEHLEGRTLKQLIVEEAPLAQDRAIDLAIQILAAAGFAHQRGVVHRDFKPQNVIVDAADRVKVTDFGIARAGASEMTETGSILGTAQYLSPEQAQGHAVGAASDLYSIGVTLYEMVCGRLPFEADSAVATAVQHLSQPPPPPSQIRLDVHPGLEATILRALAKDPNDRWQTADDFMAGLQAARAAMAMGDDGQGTAVWGALPAHATGAESGRRRIWPWAIAFVVAVVAAVAAFLLFREPVQVQVPELIGRSLADAQPGLEEAGLRVQVEKEENPAPLNQVIGQSPAGGTEVDERSVVTLTVSTGPETARIPEVRGLSKTDALRALQKRGFTSEVEDEFSPTIAAGMATGTVPGAGATRRVDVPVVLTISAGPRVQRVPRVVGLGRADAESRLDDAGFKVGIQKIDSEQLADEVVSQSPEPGTDAEEGETVALMVSNGRLQPEPVPNVGGLDEGRAEARLRSAGFEVRIQDRRVNSESQDGVVLDQSPNGGQSLARGETVDIIVGRLDTSRGRESSAGFEDQAQR